MDILESQSSGPGVSSTTTSDTTQEQIVQFADQNAGWATTVASSYESTMDLGHTPDSSLGDFLKRPIRESAQTWLVGQPFFYKFNPWTAFCENPQVLDKIKNYQLLRMKLHVKMVISGTRFHYGRALASYNPYTGTDQVTVQRNFILQDMIQASQKPHIFLNPTKNTGGELNLPFFWDENYFGIPDADWRSAGDIVINSFGNLLHANGGDDPVTITIYVWASDIVLTVPTSSNPPLVSQSGRPSMKMGANDEYGDGIISKTASAIAVAAGKLKDAPYIGPYMTATQVAADATGTVAKMFGMSRPNIITNIQQMKPLPAGNLANTDAHDASMKLTLDSKAELTVDSRVAGLDGSDQMGITEYACRESYLTQFVWSPADVKDTLLWNTQVLPMQLDNIQNEIHMTPLAHVASCFEKWQGSLKFRFQVVKSDFHKGRILVRWDPNLFTSEVNYNTNYSRVIDIAEMEDFEIIVGWGQAAPWKECGQPYATGSNFSSSQRLLGDFVQGNGVLDLTVLNDLVSPSADTNITINVYVSACDDIKFADPTNRKLTNFHLFKPPEEVLESQSGVMTELADSPDADKPTGTEDAMTIGSTSKPDQTYLVYYGDPPTSIRDLCKRYTFSRFWYPQRANSDTVRIGRLRNKNLPYYTGYDALGIDTTSDATPATVGPTTFISWFTPAYAAYRGSMRKKYLFSGPSNQSPNVTRGRYFGNGNGGFTYNEALLSLSPQNISKFLTARWNDQTGAGAAATNLGINNTIEVDLPFYWDRRFASARTIAAQQLQCNSHLVATTSTVTNFPGPEPATFEVAYQQFDAVGEDFNLLFFTGVPIYYSYSLTDLS